MKSPPYLLLLFGIVCLSLIQHVHGGLDGQLYKSTLSPSYKEASSNFGRSISVSGDGMYAVAGSPDSSINGTSSGHATVFVREGVSWTEQQMLFPDDNAARFYTGHTSRISKDGLYILISTQGREDVASGVWGAAYLFHRTGTVWAQEHRFLPSDGLATGMDFAFDLDISDDGSFVVISDPYNSHNGLYDTGAVYAYERNGTTWTELPKILPTNFAEEDFFGFPLKLSGDATVLVVGSNVDSLGNPERRFTFKRTDNVWTQVHEELLDYFLFALSSDGSHLAYPYQNVTTYVYRGLAIASWNGSTWNQEAHSFHYMTTATNGGEMESLSFSGDGSVLVVGTSYTEDPTLHGVGSISIYTRDGSTWTLSRTILPNDGNVNDYFAKHASLSYDGSHLITSSPFGDTEVADGGSVYYFRSCAAGSYCTNETSILPCPMGSYCPVGSSNETLCTTAGSYCPEGSSSESPCAVGHYCPTLGEQVACTKPGSYCPERSSSESRCAAGHYCPSPVEQVACTKPGSYCPEGSTQELTCAAGFECTTLDAKVACESGSYCPEGTTLELPCPAGSVCSTPKTKTTCGAGNYCPEGSVTETICADGSYCPAGSTTESQCAAGSVCPTPATQSTCSPGSYCPVGSTTETPCAPGSFCAAPDTQSACSAGSYCPVGSTAESQCAAGSVCPTPATQSTCSPGSYCPVGSTAETPCALESFCPTPATQSTCSPGSYCPVGSTSEERCAAGSVCPTPASQTACRTGLYCPEGSTTETPCATGSACPTPATQQQCTPGTFGDAPSLTACFECPAGSYSSASGSTSCTECAKGTYAAIPGQSQCRGCDIGKFVNSTGALQCKECPVGYYTIERGQSSCEIGCPTDAGGQICSNHGNCYNKGKCECAPGYYGSLCEHNDICGNGIKTVSEQCDTEDTNSLACIDCVIQPGYVCFSTPISDTASTSTCQAAITGEPVSVVFGTSNEDTITVSAPVQPSDTAPSDYSLKAFTAEFPSTLLNQGEQLEVQMTASNPYPSAPVQTSPGISPRLAPTPIFFNVTEQAGSEPNFDTPVTFTLDLSNDGTSSNYALMFYNKTSGIWESAADTCTGDDYQQRVTKTYLATILIVNVCHFTEFAVAEILPLSGSSDSDTDSGAIVAIVFVLLICIGVALYVYQKVRQDRLMRQKAVASSSMDQVDDTSIEMAEPDGSKSTFTGTGTGTADIPALSSPLDAHDQEGGTDNPNNIDERAMDIEEVL